MNTVFVLSLQTNSGDNYTWVLDAFPSQEQVFNIFKRDIPYELGEAQDDPHDAWGTAQNWNVDECELEYL